MCRLAHAVMARFPLSHHGTAIAAVLAVLAVTSAVPDCSECDTLFRVPCGTGETSCGGCIAGFQAGSAGNDMCEPVSCGNAVADGFGTPVSSVEVFFPSVVSYFCEPGYSTPDGSGAYTKARL